MIDYKNDYIGIVFNAISQLGNALAGGTNDVSISARIGYNAYHNHGKFWKVCQSIVNFTFRYVDGENHCYRAYKSDIDEDHKPKGFWIGLVIMSYLMMIVCIPVSAIAYTIHFIKVLFN